MRRLRKPVCGKYGQTVVAVLCAWEIAALPKSSPVPTISEVVRRAPLVGVVLLCALLHHWFVELVD